MENEFRDKWKVSFKIDGKCVSNRWKASFKTGRRWVKNRWKARLKTDAGTKFKIGG